MTSFPHNLVLDSQPRFGLTLSECLHLYNFLINQRFFMKLVAKYSASVSLSDQVHVKVCNPIPLREDAQKWWMDSDNYRLPTEHAYSISSPCEPYGSGELKIRNKPKPCRLSNIVGQWFCRNVSILFQAPLMSR